MVHLSFDKNNDSVDTIPEEQESRYHVQNFL